MWKHANTRSMFRDKQQHTRDTHCKLDTKTHSLNTDQAKVHVGPVWKILTDKAIPSWIQMLGFGDFLKIASQFLKVKKSFYFTKNLNINLFWGSKKVLHKSLNVLLVQRRVKHIISEIWQSFINEENPSQTS